MILIIPNPFLRFAILLRMHAANLIEMKEIKKQADAIKRELMKVPDSKKKLSPRFFQCECKSGSDPIRASHVDRLLVCLDDVFYNCQSKTCTTGFTGAALVDPVKAFEQSWKMLRFNSQPVIGNFNENVLI